MPLVGRNGVPPSLPDGESVRQKVSGTHLGSGGQSVVGDAVTLRSPPQPMVLLPELWSACELADGADAAADAWPFAVETRDVPTAAARAVLIVVPAVTVAARAPAAVAAVLFDAELGAAPEAPSGAPRGTAPKAATLIAHNPPFILPLTSPPPI